MNQNRTRVLRIGPCGGNGGVVWDIPGTPSPTRLESITISYGGVIDGIEFSYINQSGQRCTTGRWCGKGGTRTQLVSENLNTFYHCFLPRKTIFVANKISSAPLFNSK